MAAVAASHSRLGNAGQDLQSLLWLEHGTGNIGPAGITKGSSTCEDQRPRSDSSDPATAVDHQMSHAQVTE